MTIREPDCVALKRRGAEHVAKLLAGKTQRQQLEFWQQRTQALLSKQASTQAKSEKSTAEQDAQTDRCAHGVLVCRWAAPRFPKRRRKINGEKQ